MQLRFNTTEELVLVEGFKYTGATYKLLRALHDVFLPDYQALKPHDSYRKLRAAELAGILQIEEEAVRRRVSTFRQQVAKDFMEGLKRVLDDNDVVENHRDWNGYRLNPLVVKLVAWEQEMVATPRPSRRSHLFFGKSHLRAGVAFSGPEFASSCSHLSPTPSTSLDAKAGHDHSHHLSRQLSWLEAMGASHGRRSGHLHQEEPPRQHPRGHHAPRELQGQMVPR